MNKQRKVKRTRRDLLECRSTGKRSSKEELEKKEKIRVKGPEDVDVDVRSSILRSLSQLER